MSDGTYRGQWIDAVYRAVGISAEVKLFMLTLDHHGLVADNGRISEPRDMLAELLGCHFRKVTAKFQAAITGGYMRQISRGQKHQTAVYQVTIPGVPEPPQGARARHPERSQGAAKRHPEVNPQGDKNRHPENAQGAADEHPEAVSGCQQPAPHIHTHAEDGGQQTEAIVAGLFEEELQTTGNKSTRESAEPERFDEFWTAYPRKVAKPAAKKAWAKALKAGADPEQIIWAARAYATSPRRKEADISYTKYPAGWLNDGRYEDQPESAPITKPAGYATNKHHESDAGAKLAEAFL